MSTKENSLKRKSDNLLVIHPTKISSNATSAISPIKISLPSQPKEKLPELPKKPNDEKIRQVFNSDDESEEEEIPVEARIRMRNLGRFTPTSCGPNSFGKSRLGFIDRRALLDKQTEALNSAVSDDNNSERNIP